jgi:hypothetical protein
MLHREANKYSGTKQATSAIKVASSRSHGRRDIHRDDNNSLGEIMQTQIQGSSQVCLHSGGI